MENNRLAVLKRRSDFQKLKNNGTRVRPSRWLLLSFQKNDGVEVRCGWTVSKKVGSAVVRNRLKRWCREFFRNIDTRAVAVDVNVIFLSQSKDQSFFKSIKYSEFHREISAAWERISQTAIKA